MKRLKTIKPKSFDPAKRRELKLRRAARAIVMDRTGKVALLRVAAHAYHKLPGGGIEKAEDNIEALHRECREEIGCEIEVLDEVGYTIEYRVSLGIQQRSYCYLARVVGKKGEPHLTYQEKRQGFEVRWLTIDRAIEIVSEDEPDNYEGKFIRIRDSALLQAGKKFI